MTNRAFRLLLALPLAAGMLTACSKADVPAAEPAVPGTAQPANFPAMHYAVAANPPSAAAFALGRRLFYDVRLSRDSTVSCGSCHHPAAAFADPGAALSRGVAGRVGTRSSPPLQNLRWRRTLLWDGGASHLETMPVAPLTNPLEMDETLPHVLAKLNRSADYRAQFAAVYGAGPIDSYRLLRALAQFTAALTSANTRYDRYVRREAGGELSASELRGLLLVRQHCASCHATDLFTDESFRNNGLDRAFPQDSGRAGITDRRQDVGDFKVPSLRNVALTAPYMHDGRLATLPDVLRHYAQGVQPSATLDPALRRADGALGLALTAAEQADIVAFLGALTDQSFVENRQLAARP